jgi:hypothetical protein
MPSSPLAFDTQTPATLPAVSSTETPTRRPSRRRALLVFLGVLALAGVFAGTAFALRFSDASYLTPEGIVGVPYSHRFEGVAGSPPYDFKVIRGSLPPGLTMDSGGQVRGTPTQAGSWSFWVELSDTFCGPNTATSPCAQREFSIGVVPGLEIEQGSLPIARPGAPYSLQLTAKGGGSQTWTIVGGALPPGFTLSSTGLLSGTSTAAGVYGVVIQVADAKRSARREYRLVVTDPLEVILPTSVPLEVGIEFRSPEANLKGGVPPFAWAVQEGALPPGLVLDPATGIVSGTPQRAGQYLVKLSVTDAAGQGATLDATLDVAPVLRVTTRRLPNGKVGKPYSMPLQTRGGVEPLRWQVGEGTLPRGLVLTPRTGIVVGRPKQGGRFRVTFVATDRLGATSARTVLLIVKKMTIATSRLPNGTVGRAYSARLATRNGVAPIRWQLVNGKLPRGLRLAPRTGAVVGKPQQGGAFVLTFRARDRYGDVSTRRVRLVVRGTSSSA